MEIDRFYAGPRDRGRPTIDAQARALARIVETCERIRPQLASVETLATFIQGQRDSVRIKRRISVALALHTPDRDLAYGRVGPTELAAFRTLALHQLAAVSWVFS